MVVPVVTVRGRGCAKHCKEERAADSVACLAKAIQLANETPPAPADRRSVEQMVLDLVLDVLTCYRDQKRPFFCPRRERDSIIEV